MNKITIGSDQYKTFWEEDDTFFIHIEPREVKYTSYKLALVASLLDRHLKNPTVLLSGGLDSELAAVAAVDSGVTPKLVHFEYQIHGLNFNTHDRYWADQTAWRLALPLEVIPVDVYKFFESGEYLEWATKYKIPSPQIALQVACLDKISGPVIMGGNLFQGPNSYQATSGLHGAHRYWDAAGKVGIELLQDSYELYSLSQNLPGYIGRDRIASGHRKSFLFNSWGFPYHFEERPKHTGFELIQQHYANEGRDWNQMFRLGELSTLVRPILTKFV